MSTATVTHHHWSEIVPEQITPAVSRRYITAERVTIARFELKRGGIVPLHAHDNEQVSFILDGALRFKIDGREIVVRGGELIQIPGNVPHEVEVLEDTLALDVFSPVRRDWIEKTDTYFTQGLEAGR
jgi:quercetin dioxygenase-like cupin family protein